MTTPHSRPGYISRNTDGGDLNAPIASGEKDVSSKEHAADNDFSKADVEIDVRGVLLRAASFSIDSRRPSRVCAGELVYVPKDTEFTLEFASRYAKVYVFVNGRGLVGLLQDLGQTFRQPMLPEQAVPWAESNVESVGSAVGLQFV